MIRNRDIEIMAPAGSFESLSAAIKAGADSVYFGVGILNMRARSSANFTLQDMEEIVERCHSAGVKAYLTLNTVIYDDETHEMLGTVEAARTTGVDAIIASDHAVISAATKADIPVHISTQLNVSNMESLRFYSQWADTVVLARELSLDQIKIISEAIRKENIRGPGGDLVRIEMFAHGALCMAVSGKCYLSLHESCNSANRGACRQICRRSYTLTDADTGEEIRTEGKYLLSPKDLCTIDILDKFLDGGVSVLKIEGRARSAEYVKRVVECYREGVNSVIDGTFDENKIIGWKTRLSEVFNRGFWGGYYLGKPLPELSTAYGSSATKRKVYVGKVTNFFKKISVAEIMVEAAPLSAGEDVVVMGATTGALEFKLESVYVDEKPAETALQGIYCSIHTPSEIRRGDKLYKVVDAELITSSATTEL